MVGSVVKNKTKQKTNKLSIRRETLSTRREGLWVCCHRRQAVGVEGIVAHEGISFVEAFMVPYFE